MAYRWTKQSPLAYQSSVSYSGSLDKAQIGRSQEYTLRIESHFVVVLSIPSHLRTFVDREVPRIWAGSPLKVFTRSAEIERRERPPGLESRRVKEDALLPGPVDLAPSNTLLFLWDGQAGKVAITAKGWAGLIASSRIPLDTWESRKLR